MAKVIILGGGVAGMSAAHELIERGYEVEVYEYNYFYVGGKARSVNYKGKRREYENPLPGEHGFRFFPGFYKHIIDTMKRIPYTDSAGKTSTVFENLTPTETIMVAQYDKKPIVTLASFPKSIKELVFLVKSLTGVDSGLTKEEEVFFAERVWQLMTSCKGRRINEYERLGWWQYLEADYYSKAYQHLLVEGLTRTLVAAKAETASTKTGGDIFLQLLFCMTDPSVETDRVLNGPTNLKWLNPWKEYLEKKGVKYYHGWECTGFETDTNTQSIQSVQVKAVGSKTLKHEGNTKSVTGDYYILALPVEKAAHVITPDMITCDKTLEYVLELAKSVSWMNGIQYYLNEDIKINKGHIICSDSEWAVTAISQTQFWKDYSIDDKGNGKIKGVLSVDISDWFSPGLVNKKMADECTKEEIKDEVWEQLKKSFNIDGRIVLRDDMIEDYFLDRDIEPKKPSVKSNDEAKLVNFEPLLVNNVNTWNLRPESSCDIKNLFLAGDYIRTNTDLATMEGANESARRAVNCILDIDKSTDTCDIWNLSEPWFLAPMKKFDRDRFNKGLPWSIHAPKYIEVITVIGGIIYMVMGIIKEFFTKK